MQVIIRIQCNSYTKKKRLLAKVDSMVYNMLYMDTLAQSIKTTYNDNVTI